MLRTSPNLKIKLLANFIFVLPFITLIFLFSVSPRGFEIADEGFHLLASKFPMEVQFWPNVAHIYTGVMFQIVRGNIIALRMLNETLLFSSATLFFFGLFKLLTTIYPDIKHFTIEKKILWAMMSLGSLFYFIYFDTTPSYNSLNAILLNTTVGLFCFTLANLNEKTLSIKINSLSFLNGLFLGITLLVKFPTSITLIGLFAGLLLIWPQISNRFVTGVWMMVGTAVWILLHTLFFQSAENLWDSLHQGVQVFLTFGLHKPGYCFQHYSEEIINLIQNGFLDFLATGFVPLLCFLIFFRYLENKTRLFTFLSLDLLIFFCLQALQAIHLKFYRGGDENSILLMQVYTGWLLLLSFTTLLILFCKKNFNVTLASKRASLIILFLLALPFAGAMGTANIITLNLAQYMAAWFAFMWITLLIMSIACNSRWLITGGACILTLFATCQIISSGFIDPYNLNTPIQHQTKITPIGVPVTYLKLDRNTHEFFIQINQLAKSHGFKPGDDILAFNDMAGVVFALGGKSPVVPWYMSLPNSKKTNGWLLQQASLTRLKKAFILENKHGQDFMPDLNQVGLHFPRDYILCGEVSMPISHEWLRLWKPKSI
jgi:hypothetical protein